MLSILASLAQHLDDYCCRSPWPVVVACCSVSKLAVSWLRGKVLAILGFSIGLSENVQD